MIMNCFCFAFLTAAAVVRGVRGVVLMHEDFEDEALNISRSDLRGTSNCNIGMRVFDDVKGWVWQEHMVSVGDGLCCEQTYFGFGVNHLDLGSSAYHRFWFKYGDNAHPYNWEATSCSEWGHEYKFPDVYTDNEDRVIVKHRPWSANEGFVSLYLSSFGYFPPQDQDGRNWLLSNGISILREATPLTKRLQSNVWYYLQFALILDGAEDSIKIWMRELSDASTVTAAEPDYHYTGDLFVQQSNWNVWWNWGFKNHGFSTPDNYIYSDDYTLSTEFISGYSNASSSSEISEPTTSTRASAPLEQVTADTKGAWSSASLAGSSSEHSSVLDSALSSTATENGWGWRSFPLFAVLFIYAM